MQERRHKMRKYREQGFWKRAVALSMAILALLPVEHPFGLEKQGLGHKHHATTHKS